MQLAKVIGSMVSTRKSDRLHGLKLLVAVPIDMDTFEEKGAPFITVDTVGAGEGGNRDVGGRQLVAPDRPDHQ